MELPAWAVIAYSYKIYTGKDWDPAASPPDPYLKVWVGDCFGETTPVTDSWLGSWNQTLCNYNVSAKDILSGIQFQLWDSDPLASDQIIDPEKEDLVCNLEPTIEHLNKGDLTAGGCGPWVEYIHFWFDWCVAKGTLITLASGERRPVEDVRVGDIVLSFDKAQGLLMESDVRKVLVHSDGPFKVGHIVTAQGADLILTGNHPVFKVGEGFKPAKDLVPGDMVLALDPTTGSLIETMVVAIIRDESEQDVVYNLKTALGNYFANDLLVHNKCLAKGSLIDTPSGQVPIEEIRVGQVVFGNKDGQKVPTRVTHVYRKQTVASSLPGRRLSASLAVTINHRVLLGTEAVEASDLDDPFEPIAGDVFDLATETANYYADGVLLLSGE